MSFISKMQPKSEIRSPNWRKPLTTSDLYPVFKAIVIFVG